MHSQKTHSMSVNCRGTDYSSFKQLQRVNNRAVKNKGSHSHAALLNITA